jgi:hypothetical protein
MVILLVVFINEIKQLHLTWHQTYLGKRTEQRKCVDTRRSCTIFPSWYEGRASGIAFMSRNVRVSSQASCGCDAVRQALNHKRRRPIRFNCNFFLQLSFLRLAPGTSRATISDIIVIPWLSSNREDRPRSPSQSRRHDDDLQRRESLRLDRSPISLKKQASQK